MSAPHPQQRANHRRAVIASSLAAAVLVGGGVWFAVSRTGGDAPTASTWSVSPSVPAAPAPSVSAPETAPSNSASGTPSPSSSAPPAPTSWRTVTDRDATGQAWSYRVPASPEWTSPGDTMAYADAKGSVLVRATSPSYFRAGYCTTGSGVARSWVGWAAPVTGDTAVSVTRRWVEAIALGPDGRTLDPSSPVREVPMPDRGGMQVQRATSVVTLRSRDDLSCLPPAVVVTATSYIGLNARRTMISVRDVVRTDGLSPLVTEQVFASVRQIG